MNETFTPQAAKIWEKIPDAAKAALVSNVWCGQCSNIKGAVKQGDLVLSGACKACDAPVARLIESS